MGEGLVASVHVHKVGGEGSNFRQFGAYVLIV